MDDIQKEIEKLKASIQTSQQLDTDYTKRQEQLNELSVDIAALVNGLFYEYWCDTVGITATPISAFQESKEIYGSVDFLPIDLSPKAKRKPQNYRLKLIFGRNAAQGYELGQSLLAYLPKEKELEKIQVKGKEIIMYLD